jgi:hypothetical protein
MTKRSSDKEFSQIWIQCKGEATRIAKALDMNVRSVYQRRNSIEQRLGVLLPSSNLSTNGRPKEFVEKIGSRISINVKDGVLIAFGDEHIWPGDYSLARHALVWAIREFSPKAMVCDGDAFDGARISRHAPSDWVKAPDVSDELDRCKELMGEIESLSPPGCKLVWTMGNHDSRFSARLAQTASEYVRIQGFDLPDHFPAWNFAWSCFVNETLVIKHRYKGGVHSSHNNTLSSGMSIATGHDHMLKVTPYHDYKGIRYGVNLGFLSDHGPEHTKFGYGEDNPSNWGSGFGLFTFDKDGVMLPPEVCSVVGDKAYFRGKVVAVRGKKSK